MKNLRRKKDSLGGRKSNRKFGGEKSPPFFISFFFFLCTFEVNGQEHAKNVQEFSPLKKRVYSFSELHQKVNLMNLFVLY